MSEYILIFIAIILLFSFFRRYIFFFLLNAISKRLFNQVQQQQKQHNVQEKPEGTITIDTTNARGKKRDDDGEYVSYEEIK